MKRFNLHRYRVLEILALHAETMNELRRRKITKSANGPLADYAEHLVCKALKLDPASNSTKGYDATDKRGNKYEIKARRQTMMSNPNRFSAIRDLEQNHFKYIVAVLFDEAFLVNRAVILPISAVKKLASWQAHVNAWILPVHEALWSHSQAKDITTLLKKKQL